MLLFRGTQSRRPEQTVRGTASYTPSLFVATIYSAVPGDTWSHRPARFAKDSSVHAVLLREPKVFELRQLGPFASLREVLREIGYPENISEDEIVRVYNYLHNRAIGKAKGGEFLYKVYDPDEDWEEVHESDVPFSLLSPQTAISYVAREDFRLEPTIDMTSNVIADTFIFVDAPAIQRALLRMGYDAVAYVDVFGGAEYASRDLFDMDEEDLFSVEGVWQEYDIEDDEVFVHESYRLLEPTAVQKTMSMPAAGAVEMLEQG
jgi:hypothetical protein